MHEVEEAPDDFDARAGAVTAERQPGGDHGLRRLVEDERDDRDDPERTVGQDPGNCGWGRAECGVIRLLRLVRVVGHRPLAIGRGHFIPQSEFRSPQSVSLVVAAVVRDLAAFLAVAVAEQAAALLGAVRVALDLFLGLGGIAG